MSAQWPVPPTQRIREKWLVKHGTPAKAQVLESQASLFKAFQDHHRAAVHFRLRLQVSPAEGEPFEVDYEQWLPGEYDPKRGLVVDVLYSPGKPTDLLIDPRVPSPAMRIDQGWREAFHEGPEAQRAMADEVAKYTFGVSREQMWAAANQRVEGYKPPPDLTPNVADRLEQLVRLRDAGMIDQAQFEESKRKLLE